MMLFDIHLIYGKASTVPTALHACVGACTAYTDKSEITNIVKTSHKSIILVCPESCTVPINVFLLDNLLYTWYTLHKHVDVVTIDTYDIMLVKSTKWPPVHDRWRRASYFPLHKYMRTQLRIGVFMSDNRGLCANLEDSKYNSQVAAINYAYCLKHKYDFMYFRPYYESSDSHELYNCVDPNTGELRHAAWSKLLSTLRCFEMGYDYIVYIDSDCIFKDFNTPIETFFYNEFNTNAMITFLNNMPWDDDKPCAGFYICKNCPETHKYVRDWYRINLPDKNRVHAYEQDALWKVYASWGNAFRLVNSWMFEERTAGQFLRHICHLESDLRLTYFKKFIADKGLDYEALITKMPYISFDTAGFPV